jgi:hypothetical protein
VQRHATWHYHQFYQYDGNAVIHCRDLKFCVLRLHKMWKCCINIVCCKFGVMKLGPTEGWGCDKVLTTPIA